MFFDAPLVIIGECFTCLKNTFFIILFSFDYIVLAIVKVFCLFTRVVAIKFLFFQKLAFVITFQNSLFSNIVYFIMQRMFKQLSVCIVAEYIALFNFSIVPIFNFFSD